MGRFWGGGGYLGAAIIGCVVYGIQLVGGCVVSGLVYLKSSGFSSVLFFSVGFYLASDIHCVCVCVCVCVCARARSLAHFVYLQEKEHFNKCRMFCVCVFVCVCVSYAVENEPGYVPYSVRLNVFKL